MSRIKLVAPNLRILHINDTLESRGGAEAYMINLGSVQTEEGHSVDYYGISIERSHVKRLRILTRIYNPFSFYGIINKIRKFNPDIIHCHMISMAVSPSVLHAAKLMGIPIAMTVHDYQYICPNRFFIYSDNQPCKHGFNHKCITTDCWPKDQDARYFILNIYHVLKTIVHRWGIKNTVDVFFAPSKSLAYWLKKDLKIEAVLTPLFSDLEGINPSNIEKNNKIVYMGRMDIEKGIEYLFEAMKIVEIEVPEVQLIMIGKGELLEHYKSLVSDMGLGEIIDFKGFIKREELIETVMSAEMVVIPSFGAEMFGLVGLEASLLQRPLVLSDNFGLSERVDELKVGLLFESGNSEDLAKKILELLQNFELVKELSENTKDIAAHYSKNKHYELILSEYNNII